jgi:hypothetical protein
MDPITESVMDHVRAAVMMDNGELSRLFLGSCIVVLFIAVVGVIRACLDRW